MTSLYKPHPLIAIALGFLLTGCATQRPAIYMWETFPRQQYELLLSQGVSPSDQIQRLEAHVEKAKSTNSKLPPGLLAHLGMLHLNSGNPEKTRALWQEEKSAFPESTAYIDQLLKRLNAMPNTTRAEKPV